MTDRPRLLGAILAGGHSSRMGQDKADILVTGSTMLEMVATAMSSVTDHIVILGGERPGWECWPDTVQGGGPLAGIATALSRAAEDHVAVVAVDHPFVRPQTLAALFGLADGLPVVPVDDHGTRQVTCAVYPIATAQAARNESERGGSVQSFLDVVSFRPVAPDLWRSWGEDGRSWFSVDTTEALDDALARYDHG